VLNKKSDKGHGNVIKLHTIKAFFPQNLISINKHVHIKVKNDLLIQANLFIYTVELSLQFSILNDMEDGRQSLIFAKNKVRF